MELKVITYQDKIDRLIIDGVEDADNYYSSKLMFRLQGNSPNILNLYSTMGR
jgi:hypothetical protein